MNCRLFRTTRLSEAEFEDFQAPLLYGCDLCFVAGKGVVAKISVLQLAWFTVKWKSISFSFLWGSHACIKIVLISATSFACYMGQGRADL